MEDNPCENCSSSKGTCDGCIENIDTNYHEEGINPWSGHGNTFRKPAYSDNDTVE